VSHTTFLWVALPSCWAVAPARGSLAQLQLPIEQPFSTASPSQLMSYGTTHLVGEVHTNNHDGGYERPRSAHARSRSRSRSRAGASPHSSLSHQGERHEPSGRASRWNTTDTGASLRSGQGSAQPLREDFFSAAMVRIVTLTFSYRAGF
jgi:hypothetical protein